MKCINIHCLVWKSIKLKFVMHGLQTKSASNTKFIIGLLSQINKLVDEQLYMCNMLIHTFVPQATLANLLH